MRLPDRGRDLAVLRSAGGWITHTHIANTRERRLPAHQRESGYAEFIGALRQGGYTGNISIEGCARNIEADCTRAVALFRTLC